ncbi:Carbohydrate sulfotransferase 11 [Mactra antiquata]
MHWAPIGPEVVKRYRDNPSEESLKYGHDITFHELVRFLVDEFEAGNNLDEHIRPMYLHCEPCDYPYDFIGNLETIESDWHYLKYIWQKKKIAELPDDVGKDIREGISEWRNINMTLHRYENTTISQYKLFLRVWSYHHITGRVCKDIAMPIDENNNIGIDEFQTTLTNAIEQSKLLGDKCKKQKKEAKLQAYATVPLELLERLQKVVEVDCNLFGYETRPDWVFVGQNIASDFNYFKGIA